MAILSEFTVGGALSRTFGLLRRRGGATVALAFVLSALPVLLFGLVPRFLLALPATVPAQAAPGRPALDPTLVMLFGFGNTTVQLLGSTLVLMAVARLAHGPGRGAPASFGASAGAALRALPAAVVVMALSSLGILIGFVLLIVPGVMLVLRWAVAYPALVVERPGILGALGRSRDLTEGHRWAVLGFALLVALMDLVLLGLSFGVGVLAALAASGSVGQAAVLVGGTAVNTALAALNGAAYAALYLELRQAKEGLFSAEAVEAFA